MTEPVRLGDHDVGDVEARQGEVRTVGLEGEVGGVVGAREEVGATGAQPPRRQGEDRVQLLEVPPPHGVERLAHGHAVERELGVLVLVDRLRAVARDAPDEVGGALDGVPDDADVEHGFSLPSSPWPIAHGGLDAVRTVVMRS